MDDQNQPAQDTGATEDATEEQTPAVGGDDHDDEATAPAADGGDDAEGEDEADDADQAPAV